MNFEQNIPKQSSLYVVNAKNKKRVELLHHLANDFSLSSVHLNHKTYHHFVGQGAFDSNVDILLFSKRLPEHETLSSIMCKLENPLILSHHDIILSRCYLPHIPDMSCMEDDLLTAPKIALQRNRACLSASGLTPPQGSTD